MMKKIALTFLIFIAVAGAIFFYVRSTPEPIPLKADSQQDTAVDTDSSRDTFEYFLSGLGETDMENLQRNFQKFNQQQPGVDQINEEQVYLAIAFTNLVAAMAETEGHHPALLTEWGKVTVTQTDHLYDQSTSLI